jgi:hypothetical protein
MQSFVGIYGVQFLSYLGISQFALKGLLNMLMGLGFYPIMTSLGVDVQAVELMSLLLFLPWVIKPIIGIMRDRFHSYWLLVQACIIGMIGSILLIVQNYFIVENINIWINSPWFIAASFSIINYEIATIDIVCEAKYSKLMVENNANLGINIFNQVLFALGHLLAAIVVGFLPVEFTMVAIILLALVPLVPSTVNLIDDPSKPRKACISDPQKDPTNGLIIISVTITVFAIILAILLMTKYKLLILIIVIFMYITLLILVYRFMNIATFKFSLYIILLSFTWCDTENALKSFFTSDCSYGYSYEFYLTSCSIVAFIVSFPLIVYFNRLFGCLPYNVLLFVFDNIQNISMALYLPVLLLGFDSKVYTIICYIASYTGTALFSIAITGMFSKCSIENHEATSFAIMVGIYNMTIMTSIWFSSELYSLFDIANCNYDSLWILILLFNIIIPLLTSFPLAILLPGISQTESLRKVNTTISNCQNYKFLADFVLIGLNKLSNSSCSIVS